MALAADDIPYFGHPKIASLSAEIPNPIYMKTWNDLVLDIMINGDCV